MGISSNTIKVFDLDSLIDTVTGLDILAPPFQHEEIDLITWCMPTDKEPRPDGFNGMFMKICWSIIKNDFYALCEEFFCNSVNLECINSSFITLVPKVRNPETVSDFRPISLINISLKLLTKILVDKLQSVILKLVHKNQYGFIRSCLIQDCLPWSFEYIHQCHHSRRRAIVLKLDFEKAFDTVEHPAILLMLQKLGFLDRYLAWIQSILSSGSSAVLLNGVSGKFFKCKRGVRQGDPFIAFTLCVGCGNATSFSEQSYKYEPAQSPNTS